MTENNSFFDFPQDARCWENKSNSILSVKNIELNGKNEHGVFAECDIPVFTRIIVESPVLVHADAQDDISYTKVATSNESIKTTEFQITYEWYQKGYRKDDLVSKFNLTCQNDMFDNDLVKMGILNTNQYLVDAKYIAETCQQPIEDVIYVAKTLSAYLFGVKTVLSDTNIGSAAYLGTTCKFNHSCEPNCLYVFDVMNGWNINVYTIRPVKKGDQLTISYIVNHPQNNYHIRCSALTYIQPFKCNCEVCLSDSVLCEQQIAPLFMSEPKENAVFRVAKCCEDGHMRKTCQIYQLSIEQQIQHLFEKAKNQKMIVNDTILMYDTCHARNTHEIIASIQSKGSDEKLMIELTTCIDLYHIIMEQRKKIGDCKSNRGCYASLTQACVTRLLVLIMLSLHLIDKKEFPKEKFKQITKQLLYNIPLQWYEKFQLYIIEKSINYDPKQNEQNSFSFEDMVKFYKGSSVNSLHSKPDDHFTNSFWTLVMANETTYHLRCKHRELWFYYMQNIFLRNAMGS